MILSLEQLRSQFFINMANDVYRRVCRLFICAIAVMAIADVHGNVIKTPHVEAELLAESAALVPGSSAMLGIRVRHTPEWHTYWINPGDAGYALRLSWILPEGVTVGSTQWPVPKRIFTGDPKAPITNFGYDGEVLLLIPVNVAATFKAERPVSLIARADWLVCRDMCIPEEGELNISLPVLAAGTTTTASANAGEFATARSNLPATATEWKAQAKVADRNLLLQIEVPEKDRAYARVEAFSVAEGSTDTSVHTVHRTETGFAIQMRLASDAGNQTGPMNFVVAYGGAAPAAMRSLQISAPITRGSTALPTDPHDGRAAR